MSSAQHQHSRADAPQPTLPLAVVDEIFQRLTRTYGHPFLNRWDGIPLLDVKQEWAATLGRFAKRPEAIAFALDNPAPGIPPSAPDFAAICARCPQRQEQHPLLTDQGPKPGAPADVRKQQEQLRNLTLPPPSRLRWATRFIALWDGKPNLRHSQRQDLRLAHSIVANHQADLELEERKARAQALTESYAPGEDEGSRAD